MLFKAKVFTLTAFAAIVAPIALIGVSRGSDHADTPEIAADPGADITDVYFFPSPTNPNNVVAVMDVHPLIGPGQGPATSFDPNVLYQMKFDNVGDGIEHEVIQAKFSGTGANQQFVIVGPIAPHQLGAANSLSTAGTAITGNINTVYNGYDGSMIYCGAREDPFFFDLEQFFTILPDRATPLNGVAVNQPDKLYRDYFRKKGAAVDFLSNGQYNVLSIVIEMPRSWIKGTHTSVVGLWATTNVMNDTTGYYDQMDRLGRPAVNELFATVAYGRHKINDLDQPRQDKENLGDDIQTFMTGPARRSQAITDVVKAVLAPDYIKADLSSSDPATYLGYETGGATGGKFGGRALTDDVIDISLGVVFGNTVPALGLAPDDGNETPGLTTDNVDDSGKHFLSTFPYLGNPR